MHAYTHQYNMGEQRISTATACTKAYPTHHSWIMTAQISLGNMENNGSCLPDR